MQENVSLSPARPRLRPSAVRTRTARLAGRRVRRPRRGASARGKLDEAADALEQAYDRYRRKGNFVSAERAQTRLAELLETVYCLEDRLAVRLQERAPRLPVGCGAGRSPALARMFRTDVAETAMPSLRSSPTIRR